MRPAEAKRFVTVTFDHMRRGLAEMPHGRWLLVTCGSQQEDMTAYWRCDFQHKCFQDVVDGYTHCGWTAQEAP